MDARHEPWLHTRWRATCAVSVNASLAGRVSLAAAADGEVATLADVGNALLAGAAPCVGLLDLRDDRRLASVQLLYDAAVDACGIGAAPHAGQPTPVACTGQ